MEIQKQDVKPTVVKTAAPVTDHHYSDEEIRAFIEEEMADLLSPVEGNSPEAIAFNKAVAGISEFRKLAVVADNAAMAGDDETFTKTVNEAMKSVDSLPESYKLTMGIHPERRSTMLYTLKNGEVAVFGSELAGGDRAVKNLGTILQAVSEKLGRPHKVTSVVFSMTNPVGLLANCAPDSGAVVINLMHTFCRAYDRVTEEPQMESIAINSLFWHNIYISYIHEALHLDNEELSEGEVSTEAKRMAFEIARDYALEPGKCEFMRLQMAELTLNAKEGDFFSNQKKMFDEGTSTHFKPTTATSELKLTSYRAYMHWASGADDDDVRWTCLPKMSPVVAATKVTSVPAVTEVPLSMTAGATPVPVTPQPFEADTFFNENPAGGFQPASNNSTIKMVEDYDNWLDEAGGDGGGDFMTGDDQYAGGGFDDDYTSPIGMMAFAQATMPASMPVTQAPASTVFPPFVQAQATVTHMAAEQHSAVKVTLPKTGLTPNQTSDIARGVYAKCFQVIFDMCGQLLNSDAAFSHLEVVENTLIPLTDLEKQVVVGMQYSDKNGRWVELPPTNGLRGYICKYAKLPAYKLALNVDGVKILRRVLPQNTAKKDGSGQPTKTAIMARGGAKLLYIMEGDDNAKANGAKNYICKAVVAPGAQFTNWEEC